jgi:hypothetical protein
MPKPSPARRPALLVAVLLACAGWGTALATAAARPRCAAGSLNAWRKHRHFAPLSDAGAAACVKRAKEIHRANTPFNQYIPTAAQLQAFHSARDAWGRTTTQADPYLKYVTGDYRGTTDEIIQWAAAKWGIPVNWLRAQYAEESIWFQQRVGDKQYVGPSWYDQYPAQARVPGTYDVYESMGLAQIKWTPDGKIGAGTEPLRWESTAFDVDYEAATVRFYYDDPGGVRKRWGDPSYRPGQRWLSIAAWYDPFPWRSSGQKWYVGQVKWRLRVRPWLKPYFRP